MNSVACDDLETRTFFALAYSSRVINSIQCTGALVWNVPQAVFQLKRIVKELRTLDFEECNDEQIKELVNNLMNLAGRLSHLIDAAKRRGYLDTKFYGYWFSQIQLANEDLMDTLENLMFSTSRIFRESIQGALSGLVKTQTPRDWRSSLAEMRDRP